MSTLQIRRLQEGDRVTVLLGSREYEAEVVDSSDPAKLRIRLDSSCELWIGRRVVLDVVTHD